MSHKTYWFAAAVFPKLESMGVALEALRGHVLPGQLLIIADRGNEVSGMLDPHIASGVAIATLEDRDDSSWGYALRSGGKLSCGLRELLNGAKADAAPSSTTPKARTALYVELRRDARDGSNILVANVDNPGEQLSVARIFLRQNAERVLMHEIAARAC
jgi:hypothetical protein